jgi:pantoate--beta-alanine ligase
MELLTTIAQVRDWRRAAASASVGLVPTMGYLHAGHVSLVERARRENQRVAASVFVNPTQFGPSEDLARYPRDLERDRKLLAAAGCDMLFVPEVAEMYPPGSATLVDVGAVAAPLEGERRPGHFRGVATVVLKLFGIVQPTRAYFGEKDAQQLAVLRRMTRDLDVPVEVVGCPTVREPDGLALSSRNSYLTPAERRAAAALYRALTSARALCDAGERGGDALREAMRRTLASEPLVRVDYVSVADPDSFRELETVAGPALFSLAAFLGRARLIDNLRIDVRSEGRP